MKTILVTAYAIDPYKGSEDGMGWNFVLQIARYNQAIVVTRRNNGRNIREYIARHPERQDLFDHIRFLYFDWPYWLRWWKKGPLLSMIYFYGWQLSLAAWLLFKRLPVDIVHNLNFHNDWTPSFLWMLGKPVVWGPVGHHPKVPATYLLPVYGKAAYGKDRLLWRMKQFFWHADPFLRIAARKADMIVCMNSQAPERLHVRKGRYRIVPSVASEDIAMNDAMKPEVNGATKSAVFTVLSAGRFVPLKGFDLTIRSFACFYHRLPADQRGLVKLILAGSGPQLPLLRKIITEEGIVQSVEIIPWLPKEEMKNLYGSARVFLFPSHEGAGMVVAEAMSHGLPVVCLDNAGPGEFVHPESTLKVGYGRYEATVRELADKLTQLYRHTDYYYLESRFALQRFNGYFRWHTRGEQLQEIYAAL
jgi:glycosyltransferase involved in cell wall biosynthesis